VRRFDSRFLAAWKSEVAVALPDGGPTDELEELVWLPVAEAEKLDLPGITLSVLRDLGQRLAEDPELRPGRPVPFYRMVKNRFQREII
jgi:8-oxo-dGTP pyrophosphatase MutT (NUDIX family)